MHGLGVTISLIRTDYQPCSDSINNYANWFKVASYLSILKLLSWYIVYMFINSSSFKTSYIATSTMCRDQNVYQAGKLQSSIANGAILA